MSHAKAVSPANHEMDVSPANHEMDESRVNREKAVRRVRPGPVANRRRLTKWKAKQTAVAKRRASRRSLRTCRHGNRRSGSLRSKRRVKTTRVARRIVLAVVVMAADLRVVGNVG